MIKRYFSLLAVLLSIATALPQALPQPHYEVPGQKSPQTNPDLPKFNLDFPGGSPERLIMFINEELKKSPVNVIIPSEAKNVDIPPMKLKNVTVQQVFDALGRASQKKSLITGSYMDYGAKGIPMRRSALQEYTTSYSFQTTPPIQTNSVWYFVFNEPPPNLEEPKVCQFYQLRPYLEQGLTVNDITTAVQAGYKMLGETAAPELNFHEETQLLIAVGPDSKLKLIDQVLSQLQLAKPKSEPAKADKPKA